MEPKKCKLDWMFEIAEKKKSNLQNSRAQHIQRTLYKYIFGGIHRITYIKNIHRIPLNGYHRICRRKLCERKKNIVNIIILFGFVEADTIK